MAFFTDSDFHSSQFKAMAMFREIYGIRVVPFLAQALHGRPPTCGRSCAGSPWLQPDTLFEADSATQPRETTPPPNSKKLFYRKPFLPSRWPNKLKYQNFQRRSKFYWFTSRIGLKRRLMPPSWATQPRSPSWRPAPRPPWPRRRLAGGNRSRADPN